VKNFIKFFVIVLLLAVVSTVSAQNQKVELSLKGKHFSHYNLMYVVQSGGVYHFAENTYIFILNSKIVRSGSYEIKVSGTMAYLTIRQFEQTPLLFKGYVNRKGEIMILSDGCRNPELLVLKE
jgi:hypothetical protein